MRIVILLLVLANLALFAYTRLDAGNGGEAARLRDQLAPDSITLLTPQQVAALAPAKSGVLADVCVEWGPLADADRARALADLEPLALGRLLTQRRVAEPRQAAAQTTFVVRDPQQLALARIRELSAQYPGSDVRVGACERTG